MIRNNRILKKLNIYLTYKYTNKKNAKITTNTNNKQLTNTNSPTMDPPSHGHNARSPRPTDTIRVR